jgi:hypothetical protein
MDPGPSWMVRPKKPETSEDSRCSTCWKLEPVLVSQSSALSIAARDAHQNDLVPRTKSCAATAGKDLRDPLPGLRTLGDQMIS